MAEQSFLSNFFKGAAGLQPEEGIPEIPKLLAVDEKMDTSEPSETKENGPLTQTEAGPPPQTDAGPPTQNEDQEMTGGDVEETGHEENQNKESNVTNDAKEVTVTDDEDYGEESEDDENKGGDDDNETGDKDELESLEANDLDGQLEILMEDQVVGAHHLKKLGDPVLIVGCPEHDPKIKEGTGIFLVDLKSLATYSENELQEFAKGAAHQTGCMGHKDSCEESLEDAIFEALVPGEIFCPLGEKKHIIKTDEACRIHPEGKPLINILKSAILVQTTIRIKGGKKQVKKDDMPTAKIDSLGGNPMIPISLYAAMTLATLIRGEHSVDAPEAEFLTQYVHTKSRGL